MDKDTAKSILDSLPDDATLDDIIDKFQEKRQFNLQSEMQEGYEDIYSNFKCCLLTHKPNETALITRTIKRFFSCFFMKYEVLPSANVSEYLLDIMVTDYRPLEFLKKGTMIREQVDYKPLLAVESELGGDSANSSVSVMRNAVEDFVKLLLVSSQYKVLVFTSLPSSEESQNDEKYISERVKLLKEIHQNSPAKYIDILLIHIKGEQENGKGQVKVSISDDSISGYVIGKSIMKI